MNKRMLVFGIWALPALGLACGGECLDSSAAASDPAEPSAEGSAFAERIQALHQDLSVGSTGDDVVAVHAYLTRYGYFPSEGLQRVFPAWRPFVAEGPASASIYDEHTIEAVKHYQTVYRIPVTGIVDAKTREMMRLPRCGRPDGLKSADPSDKFGIINKWWGNQVNWMFTGTLPRDATMKTMARQATYDWEAQTSLHFTEIAAGSYDMSISFGSIPCWPGVPCFPNAFAATSPPDITGNHSDIRVNANTRWYYGYGAVPQDGLTVDFYSVILHEMGHAVGLDHSSVDGGANWGTVMTPGIATGYTKRVLQVDDKVAISSLYDQWQQLDDDTRDVGVGADGEV
jgi:peptidoglycan hydrolase-like protein with peptidoglycan-binding domain